MHKVIRVQGGDNDLVEALDSNAGSGWNIVQIIPIGQGSSSPTAGSAWIIVLRKGN